MLLITIERPTDTGQSITGGLGKQKKTPESWLQGRLLFVKESPVGPEQSPSITGRRMTTPADAINQLLFGGRQYPCMGTMPHKL